MLVVCPTPIGNLEDATPRQRNALAQADVIACEDTRTTGKLLELLGIARSEGRPALVSYHEHNAERRVPELVARLREGERVVLVSDAGTPTISDPGYRLVRAAREEGLEVTALPGPVAAAVALSGSGLPSDRWLFEGFLPNKRGKRQARLQELRRDAVTVVAYESPNRVVALLEDVQEVFGDRHEVCVARELTKKFEEWVSGPVDEVQAKLAEREAVRGEVVVVLAPATGAEVEAMVDADVLIAELLDAGLSPSAIKRVASRVTGMSKSEIWDRMERLK